VKRRGRVASVQIAPEYGQRHDCNNRGKADRPQQARTEYGAIFPQLRPPQSIRDGDERLQEEPGDPGFMPCSNYLDSDRPAVAPRTATGDKALAESASSAF